MLKLNKSPGDDGIVGEMIRALNERSGKELCELLEMIWLEEKIPEEWRKSIIVPIHKKGDRAVCSNYRGIALLPICY